MRQSAQVAVFGLGHIGLPIATTLSNAGFLVVGVDSNNQVLDAILGGKANISELHLGNMVSQAIANGHLKVTSSGIVAVKESDIIIICVPTPIKKDKTPNYLFIENVCKTVSLGLSKGKLVIVESTLPPKATENFVAPLLEEATGLKCGLDFWLAYCPERITPGNALTEFIKNDKIVGGYNTESAEVAAEFFREFIKGKVLLTDAATAEVAKLAENTFRDINIAFANELALLCEQNGVDVMEVIKLSNTHPRVKIHTPGPGVGGPCLPKDSYLLLNSSVPADYNIINAARQINDYMAQHIVKLVLQALKAARKEIKDSRIAVLGTAYKGNVEHATLSPSEPIIRELMNNGATIIVYDPLCNETFGAKKANSLHEAIKGSDCMLVATDHTIFKNLDLQEVKKLMNDTPIIIDGRRIIDHRSAMSMGITYYGVGFCPNAN